ncbi:MAG: hypothetical protein QOF51_4338, partial [Chloroflexota bacterium]|nr:hypothetical protein [Chloroflexota bacterium]
MTDTSEGLRRTNEAQQITVERQRLTISELQSPVIQVWDGI